MLKLQASPEAHGSNAEAPLSVCVSNEDYRSISLLLVYGASPSGLLTHVGQTPLHVALEIAIKGNILAKSSKTVFCLFVWYMMVWVCLQLFMIQQGQ